MEILSNLCFMVRTRQSILKCFWGHTMLTTTCYLMVKRSKSQKEVEVRDSDIDALDIGAKVVVHGKYSIPVLSWVKRKKQDSSGKPIFKEHSNPILDTRVYELEFPDVRVDEYAFNIIIDNLIDQVDDQGWDIGILEEIVAFRRDPDVDIPTGEQAYTNFNGIHHPVITKTCWDVQVKCRYQATLYSTQGYTSWNSQT